MSHKKGFKTAEMLEWWPLENIDKLVLSSGCLWSNQYYQHVWSRRGKMGLFVGRLGRTGFGWGRHCGIETTASLAIMMMITIMIIIACIRNAFGHFWHGYICKIRDMEGNWEGLQWGAFLFIFFKQMRSWWQGCSEDTFTAAEDKMGSRWAKHASHRTEHSCTIYTVYIKHYTGCYIIHYTLYIIQYTLFKILHVAQLWEWRRIEIAETRDPRSVSLLAPSHPIPDLKKVAVCGRRVWSDKSDTPTLLWSRLF